MMKDKETIIQESIGITALLSRKIAEEAPYVEYSEESLKFAESCLTDWEMRLLRDVDAGETVSHGTETALGAGDQSDLLERFYVIRELCRSILVWNEDNQSYLYHLVSNTKKLYKSVFLQDAYLSGVRVPDVVLNDFRLAHATYAPGELLQYDMPDFTQEILVPKLAFFDREISFPGIYEGVIPWVSVCPSEINSMQREIAAAHGRTLVLGLGLGYYPYRISQFDKVRSVTIIERQPEIIRLFEDYLLPQFPEKQKIRVIQADAYEYLETVEPEQYDYCFADIWENQVDGAEAYRKIKPYERRLPYTEFTYWIEASIRWWLQGEQI